MDDSFSLDFVEIAIPCKKCGSKTKKTVGWIKANHIFVCVCGHKTTLNSDEVATDSAEGERLARESPKDAFE